MVDNPTTTLALQKLNAFLAALPGRMDFELATKTNPTDENGNFQEGKFEILHIYLTTGKFIKNKLTDLILYQIDADHPIIKAVDEIPIRKALLDYVKTGSISIAGTTIPNSSQPPAAAIIVPNLPLLDKLKAYGAELLYAGGKLVLYESDRTGVMHGVHGILTPDDLLAQYKIDPAQIKQVGGNSDQLLTQGYNFDTSKANLDTQAFNALIKSYDDNWTAANVPPTAAPTPPKPTFIRYSGSPNIFDRHTGQYISPAIAATRGDLTPDNILNIGAPRPEVKTGADFAKWDGKNLTTFPV